MFLQTGFIDVHLSMVDGKCSAQYNKVIKPLNLS